MGQKAESRSKRTNSAPEKNQNEIHTFIELLELTRVLLLVAVGLVQFWKVISPHPLQKRLKENPTPAQTSDKVHPDTRKNPNGFTKILKYISISVPTVVGIFAIMAYAAQFWDRANPTLTEIAMVTHTPRSVSLGTQVAIAITAAETPRPQATLPATWTPAPTIAATIETPSIPTNTPTPLREESQENSSPFEGTPTAAVRGIPTAIATFYITVTVTFPPRSLTQESTPRQMTPTATALPDIITPPESTPLPDRLPDQMVAEVIVFDPTSTPIPEEYSQITSP